LCDSSWTVGLDSGETQEPEWFGPDCSLSKKLFVHSIEFIVPFSINIFIFFYQGHCPSSDNPRTSAVETDCYNVTAKNSHYAGKAGNLCQVDCANQGICDYSTGTCSCFDGYFGNDCHIIDPELVYKDFTTGATNDVF